MFYVNTHSIIAISIVFPLLAIITVALRFWLRIHRFHSREAAPRHPTGLWIDDWLSLTALILFIATAIVNLYGAATNTVGGYLFNGGASTLETYNPIEGLQITLEWIVNMLNAPTTGCIRLSILFYYRRIFRGYLFNIINWATIGVTIIWLICFPITALAICGPNLARSFKLAPAEVFKVCHDPLILLGALSITAIVLDMIILITPLFCIWNLQMKRAQKFWVSSIFLVGILSVIASALRMLVTLGLMLDPAGYYGPNEWILMGDETNWLGAISTVMFWTFIEVGTGLIVCCLLPLKPIMRPVVFKALVRSLRRRLGLPYPLTATPNENCERGTSNPTATTQQVASYQTRSISFDIGDEENMPEATRKQSLGTDSQSNGSA